MQYLEIIIENLIVNTIIIYIYVSFLKEDISKFKVIFSVCFLTTFDVCIKIFLENGFIENIVISIINVYIICRPKRIKELVKKYTYYVIIYFFFVGMLFFEVLVFNFDCENLFKRLFIYLCDGLALKIFTSLMWKMWINKIEYYSNKYNMLIKGIGRYKMFLDTGNFLKYSNEIPVIIINEDKYIKKYRKRKKIIDSLKVENYKLKTISGITELKGYFIKNIVLRKEGEKDKLIKKALIIFTNEKIQNDIFDGILPANILVEK